MLVDHKDILMYEQCCVIMYLGEMVVIEIDAHIN